MIFDLEVPRSLDFSVNKALIYITKHGLRFNPQNSEWTVFGRTKFLIGPQWNINEEHCL